jgi:hypothetical protein
VKGIGIGKRCDRQGKNLKKSAGIVPVLIDTKNWPDTFDFSRFDL